MKRAKILLWLVVALVSVSLAQEAEQMQAGVQVDAKLGRGVMDREITEEASTFSVGERVYLWMRVTGGAGDSVTVTWTHGEHSYEIRLGIGGSPWRTWAYKTAAYAGDWSVSVSDSQGNLLKQMNFTVAEVGMQEPSPEQ